MTYDTFKQEIISVLKNRMDSSMLIETREVLKNNNLRLDGLIMTMANVNISPTIYLNYYYELYKENNYTIDEIADRIIDCYEQYQPDCNFDTSSFLDYRKICDRIVYRLINISQNTDLLQKIPFIPYLDLAIVFYLCLPDDEPSLELTSGHHASIQITHEHLSRWNVNVNDMFRLASVNTPKLFPAESHPLIDVINELMRENDSEISCEERAGLPLYVLSNNIRFNGAAAILYKNILKKCADILHSDLIIIPSSVHEILYMPAADSIDMNYLTDMVRQVNDSDVLIDEVLSDHIYYYNRDRDELVCA